MEKFLRSKRLAFVLVGLVLAMLGVTLSYVAVRRQLVAAGEHALAVERSLTRVQDSLADEEATVRIYLASGNPSFLEETATHRRVYTASLRAVRELTQANPSQSGRVERLARTGGEKIAFMEQTVALRERGEVEGVINLVATGRGKALLDEVQSLSAAVMREEKLLGDAKARSVQSAQTFKLFAIAACGVAFLLLIGRKFSAMYWNAQALEAFASRLADSEERYRVLVENSTDLVTLHLPGSHTFFVSPSVERLLGYSPEEFVRKEPLHYVHPEDLTTAGNLIQTLRSGAEASSTSFRLRRKSGEYRWFEFHVTRVYGPDGQFRHYQSAGRDITERQELESRLAEQAEELRDLSLRDVLTGLYNRRGFLELAEHALRLAQRDQRSATVLFIDLDGLKIINDRLGHEMGDRAIAEAGDVLHANCRSSDIVARIGGDEFVVLASSLDPPSVDILKGRLERAVRALNTAPNRSYDLSFSIGLAVFDPAQPTAIEALLAEADARMYEAKAARRRKRAEVIASLRPARAQG